MKKNIGIACLLWLITFYENVLFGLKMPIQSDSLIEYETYLYYINIGHWQAIPDNILSSSLFTTYLPSLIYKVIPSLAVEFVYRLTLAFLVSFLAPVIYLILRKYTRILPSLLFSVFLLFSFYYIGALPAMGSIMVARMITGVTFASLLVFIVLEVDGRKKLPLACLVIGCLLISHYTVMIYYLAMFIVALSIGIFMKVDKKRFLSIVLLVMVISSVLFYGLVVPRIARHSLENVNSLVGEISGAQLSPDIAQVVTEPDPVSLDYIMAKAMVLIRVGFSIFFIYQLWHRKKVIIPLAIANDILIVSAIFIPTLVTVIGSLRCPFMGMPVELMLASNWYNSGRSKWYLIPFVILFIYQH